MNYIFCGKRTDTNEWIYGDLIHRKVFGDEITVIRLFDDDFDNYVEYEVIPETVGLFTGVCDKNGAKIFEGDIVHCKAALDCGDMVVIFENGEFRMVLLDEYRTRLEDCRFYHIGCFVKEIVGNIYDI